MVAFAQHVNNLSHLQIANFFNGAVIIVTVKVKIIKVMMLKKKYMMIFSDTR